MLIIIIIFLILLNIINYYENLNTYDRITIYISIFSLFLLFLSIIFNNEKLKDISHVFITIITLIISFNINNKKLIMLMILPILLTIYFWIFYKKCPLGNYKSLNYVNKFVMYIDKLNLSYPFLLIPLANLFFKLFNLY